MKRSILLASLFCGLMPVFASATGPYRSVVIKHTDTTLTRVSIESEMSTTFRDGLLVLSGQEGQLSWPVDQISSWSFSPESGSPDIWAGIETPSFAQIDILWDGNELRILNLADDSRVMLTSVDGRVLVDRKVSGSCVLGGDILRTGVYILIVNGVSRKIALSR